VTEELHKLGEVLRVARESRGLDLARVERDTKIRTRYLTALENGEYRDLPGSVYTKGFLRNYAHYLGLDPEYLTDLYRLEANGAVDRAVASPPRPMRARRARALVVTPGAIAWAILTVGVLAFVAYLGYEFVTFARTPDLRVIEPAGDVAGYGQSEYTITGVTEPNSRVTVDGLRENPVITADAEGHFSVTVKLVPGSNVITLIANDPLTQRDSAKVTRTIVVDTGVTPSPASGVLAITSPQNGASIIGPARVTGTMSAGGTVLIQARLVAPAAPNFSVTDGLGRQVKARVPSAGKLVEARSTAGADGAFTATLALAPGTWDLTVSASGSQAPGARRINVKAAPSLTGTLQVSGSPSYIELSQDNKPESSVSGRVVKPPKLVTLQASGSIMVRAGNAGAVSLTLDGIAMGSMGGSGEVVTWHILLTR
jgi:cytoskeletal protein RodZ